MSEEQRQFILAIAVGMNAAAHVAEQAGHRAASKCIQDYRKKWESKTLQESPRKMVRGDIYPPDGSARYMVAGDIFPGSDQ